MAGITGTGTTYDLPNFVGEVFSITPTDTPFLSAIGGLTGGRQANAPRFEWQFYDLRAASDARQRLEGADAQTAEERVRAKDHNVVEIHQEAVSVSYTKQAAIGLIDATSTVQGTNPVTDEVAFQVQAQLAQIARDIEQTFITGTFQEPANNSTPRKTRGLLEAIVTNVASNQSAAITLATSLAADDIVDTASPHGFAIGDTVRFTALTGGAGLSVNTDYFVSATSFGASTFRPALTKAGAPIDFTSDITAGTVVEALPLTEAILLDTLQLAYENGGLSQSETATLMANAWNKRALTNLLITQKNYQEQSRDVGGVSLQTIETDFGRLNVMLNRYMPKGTIAVVSMEECAPVFLNIPGKGFLFVEDLAKTGARESKQLYGEVGLEYGNQRKHAKITGLSVG